MLIVALNKTYAFDKYCCRCVAPASAVQCRIQFFPFSVHRHRRRWCRITLKIVINNVLLLLLFSSLDFLLIFQIRNCAKSYLTMPERRERNTHTHMGKSSANNCITFSGWKFGHTRFWTLVSWIIIIIKPVEKTVVK